MKEITVISGKGGTGKTSITAALASIADNVMLCDNDVDAADLHLLANPEIEEEFIFKGAWLPIIDANKCTACGLCSDNCRFDAIHINSLGNYEVNAFQCEGCRLCERICPVGAIESTQSENNHWYVSKTRFGKMIHAQMGPGEENSGKLVTTVRKYARKLAENTHIDVLLNDGPPGIGCTTISAITGTDMVLLVIEPTKSGMHDIKRLIELVRAFNIPMSAIVNKYDLSLEISAELENYLIEQRIPLLAKIPFDEKFVNALVQGKTIVEFSPSHEISIQLFKVWNNLVNDNILS